jgi:hypothetical protein
MIDFGLSRPYLDLESREPLSPRTRPGFIGTCSFASVNAHDGLELGRRDDIISWLYTVVEIAEKSLPWPGSKDRDKTYNLKKGITAAELCRSLPHQFITIYEATLALELQDEPNYPEFYRLIDEAIEQLPRAPFDWEMLDPAQAPFVTTLPKIQPAPAREPDPESPGSAPVFDKSRTDVDDRRLDEPKDAKAGKKKKKKKKKNKGNNRADETVCQACTVV